MTTPVPPTPQQPTNENLSARDFFSQDDSVLAGVFGVKPQNEEAPPSPEPTEQPLVNLAALGEGAESAEEMASETPSPKAEEIKPLTRTPMTEFAVLDDQGELEIPDIKIKFKAKGEERELALDHVVRLAQFGFANEEREQQVLAARKFVSEAQEKEQQYQARIQQYERHYERMFNDPNFYEEARIAFLNQHTPEARALRAEQEISNLRAQQQRQVEEQQVVGFVQQVLVPSTSRLLQENPLVNEVEVIGRYTQLTAPLLVNGRVPTNRLSEVQRLVDNDLREWVERVQTERAIVKDTAARAAQRQTQQVVETKRAAARVFAPQGGVPSQQSQKPIKYDSANDWLKSTFGSPNED